MEDILPQEFAAERPAERFSFDQLVPSETLLASLARLGLSIPTPVQSAALPLAFEGRDLIFQAKTGSGKTLAFVLPMLAAIERQPDRRGTLALVLTPTRELATQICDVVRSLSDDVHPVCAIGGISTRKQLDDLAHDRRFVVGTPGRLLDLIGRRELMLRTCQIFAVDEVDEMFSMDFVEDVRQILQRLPEARQGFFVSATITPRVEMLARNFLREPSKVIIDTPGEERAPIDHRFINVGKEVTSKVTALCDLIDVLNPRSAIVFCNTKSDTELVERYLRRRGYDAKLLNSDLNQKQRDAIVALTKAGKLRFLVGTDIASRGLDIEQIDLVVNYSMPDQHETYVHRTGRTGRAGREGIAMSLIGPQDVPPMMDIKKKVNVEFVEHPLPTDDEVLEARAGHLREMLAELSGGEPTSKELALAAKVLESAADLPEPGEKMKALFAKLFTTLLEQQALLHRNAVRVADDGQSGGDGGGREERHNDRRRDEDRGGRSHRGRGGRGGRDRGGRGGSRGGGRGRR